MLNRREIKYLFPELTVIISLILTPSSFVYLIISYAVITDVKASVTTCVTGALFLCFLLRTTPHYPELVASCLYCCGTGKESQDRRYWDLRWVFPLISFFRPDALGRVRLYCNKKISAQRAGAPSINTSRS